MSRAVKLDHSFDLERYTTLLNKAKGARTQTQFAKDCGLSIAYICKYLNSNFKNAPTPTTIKKIAACAANNITFEELLDAAGYNSEKYISNSASNDLNFKKIAQATILSNLINFNFSWNTTKKDLANYDLSLDLSGNIINRWVFKFISENDLQNLNTQVHLQNRLFTYYGKLVCQTPTIPKLKLSFVTTSKTVYEMLKKLPPYNLAMYVSVILINSKEMTVITEEYLDSFSDISSEINSDYTFHYNV